VLGLLKKDFFYFALSSFVLLPVLLIGERVSADTFQPLFVMLNSAFFYTLVIGPVMITEMDEEKCHGYSFLGGLPIRAREIVWARFSLALMVVAANAAGNWALIASWPARPEEAALGQSVVAFNTAMCLIVCGLAYAGIFGLGYTRFMVVVLIATVTVSLVPPLLTHGGQGRLVLRWATEFLLKMNRPACVLAGLGAYAGLMILATALFSFEPKKKSFHLW
jgi:hypothetical protein